MVSVPGSIDVEKHIREITGEEVAAYERDGWVKLVRLVSPELAEEMRRVAVGLPRPERGQLAKKGIEPFRSLMFSPKMGQNAQRLANRQRFTDRDIGMRYRNEQIA